MGIANEPLFIIKSSFLLQGIKIMPNGPKNPFGPVVGEIMSTFKCSINGGRGKCYISTEAVLLRKISFGIELDRDIIPWRAVKSLTQNMDYILVETINGKTYALNVMDDLNGKMEAFISAHEKSESMSYDKKGIKAAQDLCNLLSLLPTFEYDDPFYKTDHSHDNDGIEEHDMHKALMRLQEEHLTKLSEVACVNLQIDCGVNEFFSLFLSDDAPHSLGHHHESIGDTNVKTTAWLNKKRKIMYLHPINLPGAPSAGEATKSQTLRRFGDNGLCIDTETRITNIPFADCFYVSDRLIVTRIDSNRTSLTIKFGLSFVKRTIFRSIISATSIRDVEEFQKGFIAVIERALEDKSNTFEFAGKLSTCDRSKVSQHMNQSPANTKKSLSWIVILGLILYNLYQLQTVQNKLDLLQKIVHLQMKEKGGFTYDRALDD